MVQPLGHWAPSSLPAVHAASGAGPKPMLCEQVVTRSAAATSSSAVQLSPHWVRPTPIGCGLTNLGNSCFLNSVLQCLAHLPPLANLCLQKQHTCACRLQAASGCACCRVEDQVCRMLQRGCSAADTPSAIHRMLHVLNRSFVRGRQEDAHELLRCLVDSMERALLRQAGNYNPQRPPKYPRTMVNQLFGGILQSQVLCECCGHASNTWDPIMDLSLELGGAASLGDALARFTAVERLDGDNKYRCEGCKQLVPARKQMTIYDDPNVLVVHLKRFDGIFGKITRHIEFPTTLSLEPFMCPSRRFKRSSSSSSGSGSGSGSSGSSSGGLLNGCHSNGSSNGSSSANGHSSQANNSNGSSSSSGAANNRSTAQQQGSGGGRSSPGRYVLHGVLIHQGFSANSGHYFAYVKDGQPPAGYWHCMNDSTVYRVSEAEVLRQTAYILFYVRTTMKQQADLPRHSERDAACPQAAAAAAAAAAGPVIGPLGPPGRLKRGPACSSDGGSSGMIGPQLPPHLKRPRVAEQQQQQQQQPETPDAVAAGEQQQQGAGAAAGAVFGPALPPGWGTQQQQQQPQRRSSSADGNTGDGEAAVGASPQQQQQQQQQQFFAWARPAPEQQQQQQHRPSSAADTSGQPPEAAAAAAAAAPPAVTPEAAAAASAAEGLRARVEAELASRDVIVRPWLRAELERARGEGLPLSQARRVLQPRLRRHPALSDMAGGLLKQLMEAATSLL